MQWENKQLLNTDNRNYWASAIKKNISNTYQASLKQWMWVVSPSYGLFHRLNYFRLGNTGAIIHVKYNDGAY